MKSASIPQAHMKPQFQHHNNKKSPLPQLKQNQFGMEKLFIFQFSTIANFNYNYGNFNYNQTL